MKLKIRDLFTNPKVFIATALSFVFFYFVIPLILVAIVAVLSRHQPNLINEKLSKLVKPIIYYGLIYPAALMTCIFWGLKTLRTNNVYLISIFIGFVSSALLAGLRFLLFPTYLIPETAGNFLSITALVFVWTILLQSGLRLEKALGYGLFVEVFIHGLMLRWLSWGPEFPGIGTLVLTIIGGLIGSAFAASLFEWIIKKVLRFTKFQELNSEEENTSAPGFE